MDLYEIRKELFKGKTIYDLQLRVTFYARVSTDTEEQLNSLKAQFKYYEDYINSKGNWTFVKGYIDEGLSATSTTKREAFNEMIDDAREKKFDLILTKEVSRFARNTLDSIFYTRELLKCGVGVLFENDGLNTLDKDSELRLTIMSSLAQDESRKISERVKWGYKRKAERGSVCANDRMWGYTNNEGKLQIVEKEAEMIKKIFDYYCDDYGFRTIGKMLKEQGYTNHNGKQFNMTSIKNIIVNPRYKGYFTAKITETVDFITKERKFFKPEERITYKDNDVVPPIVSEEVWEKANHILRQKGKKMASENKTSYQNKYTYSGKIICMEHNTTFWRNLYRYDTVEDREVWQCKEYRKGGKAACHSPMLYTTELDIIMKAILNYIKEHKYIYKNKLIEIYTHLLDQTDYDKDIKELMKKIDTITAKKDKLLELSIDNSISHDEFKKRNIAFNEEIITIEEQIKKYEELNDVKNNITDKLSTVKKIFNEKFDSSKDITGNHINEMLDKIEVYSDPENPNSAELKIYLKLIDTNESYTAYIFKNIKINGSNANRSLLLIPHFIRADIQTELSPIMGSEKETEELVKSLLEQFDSDPGKIWQSNIFGKSLEVLVKDGLQNKLYKMPEDVQIKIQKTLQKIINEGNGGLICIIL